MASFKDFFENDDAPTHILKMQPTSFQAHGMTTKWLMDINQILSGIDPFMDDRVNGMLAGTPDFISPEMASGSDRPDHDGIRDLQVMFSRSQPQLAKMLQGPVKHFDVFRNNFINFLHLTNSQQGLRKAENVELARRLDLRRVDDLCQKIDALKAKMDWMTKQEQAVEALGLHRQFTTLFVAFDRFYTSWKSVEPTLRKATQDLYNQVAGQRWDKTPAIQQFRSVDPSAEVNYDSTSSHDAETMDWENFQWPKI